MTIWAEFKAAYITGVSLKDFETLASLDIPNSERVVVTPRDDMTAIWADFKAG
jgi:hypothetical protein